MTAAVNFISYIDTDSVDIIHFSSRIPSILT